MEAAKLSETFEVLAMLTTGQGQWSTTFWFTPPIHADSVGARSAFVISRQPCFRCSQGTGIATPAYAALLPVICSLLPYIPYPVSLETGSLALQPAVLSTVATAQPVVVAVAPVDPAAWFRIVLSQQR